MPDPGAYRLALAQQAADYLDPAPVPKEHSHGMNRADRRRLDREERRAPARTAKPTRRTPAIPGETHTPS